MSRVAIKICGVTREEDLDLCAELGVDQVGFNCWPGSKRYVSLERAKALRARLSADLAAVGVFVNQPPDEVARVASDLRLSAVQLHGDERPSDYASLRVPLVQVVRVAADGTRSSEISPSAARVLFDAAVAGFGGAGVRFDWSVAARARAGLEVPLLLAGGLTPENVVEAMSVVRPWGVDVASGVERSAGVKDPDKLRAFVAAVRRAEKELR